MKLLGKYIFGRDGKCLFSLNEEEDDEKHKLIYGFLQTIISFIAHFNDTTDFITYSTETYQFSVLTLPTDYKIVLITSLTSRPTTSLTTLTTTQSTVSNTSSSINHSSLNYINNNSKEYYKRLLKQFYKDVYVELIVKNPVIKPGEEIKSDLFREQVIYYYASPSLGIGTQN